MVQTFGVGASLVTTVHTPESVVYELVKSVFEQIESFRMLHPAFGQLQPANMVSNGLSAPLHPGAVRYYKEAGLLK